MAAKAAVARILSGLLCLAFSTGYGLAQEEGEGEDSHPILISKHRLDFGFSVLDDNVDGTNLAAEIGYAYNFSAQTNISVSTAYLGSRFGLDEGSGIGDTQLAFSWAPGTNISVGPWVPKRIGTGIGVTLPTGNASKGRSMDATVITPFIGLVLPITEWLDLYPGAAYFWSADDTVLGTNVSVGVIDLGLGWLSSSGYWVRLYAALIRDFEIESEEIDGADNNFFNYSLSAGRVFSDAWSASIDYDNTDYFLPGTIPSGFNGVTYTLSLKLHYNF